MEKIDKSRILEACTALSSVECFDLIPSTNLYARELLSKKDLGVSLFIAEAQSAGRGRLGRSFHSPIGAGIYMTLALPLERLGHPELLTVSTGVALCRVLERTCPTLSPSIKWVNDIYANEKKLAGILVEGVFSALGNPYALIGVGINCTDGSFSSELADIATDIHAVTGVRVERTELVCQITNELLLQLRRDFSEVVNEYRERSYLLGKEITVHPHGGVPYPALVETVDDEGRLVVRLSDGKIDVLSSADVSVRKARL